jgi:hypothetical protein
MTTTPTTVLVKAIDVKPHRYALWCTIADSKPFANEIVHRQWSEDGARIWFGLDSQNVLDAEPDEMLELVEWDSRFYSAAFLADADREDELMMSRRPTACPTCGQGRAAS